MQVSSVSLKENDQPDVIITAKESVETIRGCLEALSGVRVGEVYLCLDNPSQQDINELEASVPPNYHLIPNNGEGGKINTQIKGVEISKAKIILLLDADIRLAMSHDEFNAMLLFRISHKVDFLCPYSRGINIGSYRWSAIAECDRILRQRVIRSGRDYFGLSNLSGYFLLADREKYLSIAAESLQDDIVATINMLKNGYKVVTYPKVVCGELERISFRKHLMQRVRWTVGNIKAWPHYFSVFPHTGFTKGCIFLFTPYLWYISSYIDCIFFFFCIFQFKLIFLIMLLVECVLKTLVIAGVSKREKNIFVVFVYTLVWPFFGAAALVLSLPYTLFNWEKASRR
jgi:cellulose synthase/poly-beta-1,6-N-acetylglucosamine synthase-like glycosyltransferase